jgi:hypothetical protein
MKRFHKITAYTWLTVLTLLQVFVIRRLENISRKVIPTARPDIYLQQENWTEFCDDIVETARPDIYEDSDSWVVFCNTVVMKARPDLYPYGKGWHEFCQRVIIEGLK